MILNDSLYLGTTGYVFVLPFQLTNMTKESNDNNIAMKSWSLISSSILESLYQEMNYPYRNFIKSINCLWVEMLTKYFRDLDF